jgi:hypothetical protein
VGGQGLNLGVQDAMNLGWKLAQVVARTSPEALLDSYQAERHPVTARVLRNTLAITALSRGDERTGALRNMLGELMQTDVARHWYAAMQSGLDVGYDCGKGHPLLGRRMPDLELAADGSRRLFTLLHAAKPLLLNLGEPGSLTSGLWSERVRTVDARHSGDWHLPGIGTVPAPGAVLIRPDGHVAWVGDSAGTGLSDALTTWFGPAV